MELHKANFFFSQDQKNYKVMFVAFEDNTHAVYVFSVYLPTSIKEPETEKCICCFDTISEPSVQSAKQYLNKAIENYAQPNN